MVWQIPEELRKELAGLGSVSPYASLRYMSKGAYRTQATYKHTRLRIVAVARAGTGEQKQMRSSFASEAGEADE
jgi:hypothetical protein